MSRHYRVKYLATLWLAVPSDLVFLHHCMHGDPVTAVTIILQVCSLVVLQRRNWMSCWRKFLTDMKVTHPTLGQRRMRTWNPMKSSFRPLMTLMHRQSSRTSARLQESCEIEITWDTMKTMRMKWEKLFTHASQKTTSFSIQGTFRPSSTFLLYHFLCRHPRLICDLVIQMHFDIVTLLLAWLAMGSLCYVWKRIYLGPVNRSTLSLLIFALYKKCTYLLV